MIDKGINADIKMSTQHFLDPRSTADREALMNEKFKFLIKRLSFGNSKGKKKKEKMVEKVEEKRNSVQLIPTHLFRENNIYYSSHVQKQIFSNRLP